MAVTLNASNSGTGGLSVTSDATGNLAFQTAGTTALTITTAQNVGIGTATPTDDGGYGKIVDIYGSTGGAVYLHTSTATNYAFLGKYNSSTQLADSGSAGLTFATASGSTPVERMRIDSSGNVGIGTTSPSTKLQVAIGNVSTFGQVSNAGLAISGAGATGNYAQIGLGYAGTNQPAAIGFVTVIQTGYTYGDIVFGTRSVNTDTAPTERMRINSAGAVGIGSTAVTAGLTVANGGTNGWAINTIVPSNLTYSHLVCTNPSGNVGSIQSTNSTTAFNTASDYRLKENITPMTGALAKVAQLKPVTYKWKIDGIDGEGFIAHELAEVCSHAVSGEKDAVDADGNPIYQGVDASFLIATLTAAIQELKAINDTQAETITALTARIVALEK